MELILVRHAEPSGEASAQDVSDPPLSAHGAKQAVAVARWLDGLDVDYLVSSPARRARETATPLAERLGSEVAIDTRLRDAGAEGARYRALEADRTGDPAAYRARMQAYRHSSRLVDISERVNKACDEWCARAAGGRVVAFCHGSVVNVYAARVLGLAQPAFLEPGYASGHRFRISRGGIRSVLSLNETAYLPPGE